MNVLVIDDDKVDRLTVREYLRGVANIFEADSENQALSLLDANPIDCVLLDYLIPGTDTLALLGKMAARHLPVVMMTGEGNEDVAVRAMKLGAQDYINKRNLSDDLLRRTVVNSIETSKLRRRLEEKQAELLRANSELEEKVHQLEVLNGDLESFIHIAGHDLREPLKYLSVYCDLLEARAESNLPAECYEYLRAIKRSSMRLASLIDDLRAVTRVSQTHLDMKDIDLVELAAEVAKDFESPIHAQRVKLNIGSLPQVRGVRPLVAELLRNLISNSLKYGPRDDLIIEIFADSGGMESTVVVKNNGPGIPASELEKIFLPFYKRSPDREKEGTGIGLTLCKRIVARHGGRIWAESNENQGVSFKFTL